MESLLNLSLSHFFMFKNKIPESDISAVNSDCIMIQCAVLSYKFFSSTDITL